jgi:NADPH:quinone reductase
MEISKNKGLSIPQMQACVLSASSGKLHICNIPVPVPAAGQVLIKLDSAPVNPSDLSFIAGTYQFVAKEDIVPGFEGCGTVAAAGSGFLARRLVGRRVAFSADLENGGSWAQYCVAYAKKCIAIPDTLSRAKSCTALVNPLTAMAVAGIIKNGGYGCLVQDAGRSNLSRILSHLLASMGLPVASVVRGQNRELQIAAGATERFFFSGHAHFKQSLSAFTCASRRPALYVSASGGSTLPLVLSCLSPGSKMLAVGNLSAEEFSVDPRLFIRTGISIDGFSLGAHLSLMPMYSKLLMLSRHKRLLIKMPEPNVQAWMPLSKAIQAAELSQANSAEGKILLDIKNLE